MYFQADRNDLAGHCFWDYNGTNIQVVLVGPENGKFRYSIDVSGIAGSAYIQRFETDGTLSTPWKLWIVYGETTYPYPKEITINNIDYITGSSKTSIDSSHTAETLITEDRLLLTLGRAKVLDEEHILEDNATIERFISAGQIYRRIFNMNSIINSSNQTVHDGSGMLNANNELVTRGYVDKEITNAVEVDNITITMPTAPFGNENDINDLTNNNWGWNQAGNGLIVTGSLLNGIITATSSGEINFGSTTNSMVSAARNVFYFYGTRNDLASHCRFERNGSTIGSCVLERQEGSYYLYSIDVSTTAGMALANSYFICDNTVGSSWEMRLITGEPYPLSGGITIKEIDYIIDDDEESIDGSNTPMSNANRELITRAYVDSSISTNNIKEFTHIINATDITNKYIELATPLTKIYSFIIRGAPSQIYNLDYQIAVVNTRITWDTLGLDGQLIVGDIVTVLYK